MRKKQAQEEILMQGSHIKKSWGEWAFDACNVLFMVAFCITILIPFWDMLVRSFSRPQDISYMAVNWVPKVWTLDAYKFCFQDSQLVGAFFVSVSRAVVGTLIHLSVCCLTAYTLTRSDMPFRKVITIFFLIPMFFSGGMIPSYLNIKNLGLLDTFWVYVVPSGFSIFNTIIIRNYFYSIDSAMEEAANIDGASEFQIFSRIILPLSKPVLATVGLWQMVGQWNSWFDNMIYCRTDDSLLTLQYLLRRMMDSLVRTPDTPYEVQTMVDAANMNPDTVKAATTIIVILPIILVYPFLQKYFVKGVMVGGVKG